MKKPLLLLFYFFFSISIFAQSRGEINGTIKDALTGETIIGASIVAAEGKGTVTDIDGKYSLKLDSGQYIVTISYVGFEPQKQKINLGNKPVTLNFSLETKTLTEVEIVADVAKSRETPIAFANISTKQISEELGTRDLPILLNSTPGVYATASGGGSGDARVNVRGFDQKNVAVMVDGVPVNDMEGGWVYWSNWDGLGDITQTMQVQRGLGASKLAIPSVGGTINIITKGIDSKFSATVKQEVNNYGLYKTSFGFNSGQLKGGWGYTLAGSRKWGNEWADGTYVDAWSYFGKIQKRYKKHLFSLSANGAPQSHGQRFDKLPIAVYSKKLSDQLGINSDSVLNHSIYTTSHQERGLNYNPNWGALSDDGGTSDGSIGFFPKSKHGNVFNERVNYFHKPQFNFSHFWAPNEKLTVSTVVYLSIGHGGGTALKISGIPKDTTNGTLNAQSIYDYNRTSAPNIIYNATEHASNNYLRAANNDHFWYGIISSWNYKINKNLSTLFGIDARSYKGTHYQTVYNLMGGDYAIDNVSDKNQPKGTFLGDPNSQYAVKRVGDKVSYYNDSKVYWGGLFAQAEYKIKKWTAFLTGSFSQTGYQRIDYFKKKDLLIDGQTFAQSVGYGDVFYYNGTDNITASMNSTVTTNGDTTFVKTGSVTKYILNATGYTNQSKEARYATTDLKWFKGYTIKGGSNYNINDHHNVFVNIGYLNMAPLMTSVFDNNNQTYLNIKNQSVYAIEAGYGYKSQKFATNVNLYYTIWNNKPLSGSTSFGGSTVYYNILGLNALHKGIEIDMVYKVLKNLDFEGLISLGDWKTTSGSKADITDENGAIVTSVDFSAKNVHVGDAAQTQVVGSLRYTLFKNLYIKPRFTYFAKNYSNFDPLTLIDIDNNAATLNDNNKDRESWKMPNYGLCDLFLGYNFNYWKLKFGLTAGVLNIFNATYITDGQNGAKFDATSATVYMGMGTRFSIGLKIGF
ncbi:MAG: TonB-dependent receptor [Bacteroidetes bacterium]|nr:TonB-dependent receptor [Bacteroidota bacterium]